MTDVIDAKNVTAAFLWGTTSVPSNLLDPNLIRAGNPTQNLPVTTLSTNLADYMTTGPGRAAFNSSPVVKTFFSGRDLPAGEYTKADLIQKWGATDAASIIATHQGYFKFEGESFKEYVERVYIWGSSGFYLDDGAKFLVKSDGSREIKNYRILPYNKPLGVLDRDDA